MNVLVVQNLRGSGLGQLEPILRDAGVAIDLRMACDGAPLPPNAAGHDALVILGGAQNALADETSPYFPELLALTQSFTADGRAVLGVCLGAQLLARAFGGKNRIGAAPEFGWRDVTATAEGQADPVLGAAPPSFPIFQWHDDTFDLPAGAVRLARNEAAANQAFRIGRAAYGMQFHFEADRALVRRWSEEHAEHLAERQPDWPARRAAEEATRGAAADEAGAAIARAWVRLI